MSSTKPEQLKIASLAWRTHTPNIPTLLLFCLMSLFFGMSPVDALDTAKQISQYGHTAWRMEDGIFAATPNAIAQTTDGYLWIGTQAGLMRFDGVRFVSWRPPAGTDLPSSRINSLLGARDGSLWIGTTMGLARWRNGELINYTDPRGSIMSIVEDSTGTIWIARANVSDAEGTLCEVKDKGLRCYGREHGIALPDLVTLANDTVGNIWAAGGTTISRWKISSADTYVSPGLNSAEVFNGVAALASKQDGSLWVGLLHAGKGGGLQQLAQGHWKPFVAPGFDGSTLEVSALLVDRDSSLWVGTLNQGIYRIQGNKIDHFGATDGLSGNAVSSLFQDREGNIWIGTSRGIDNFHDLRVVSLSTRQGLSADQVNSVLASRDGTVWIGNYNLDVLRSGKISSIRPHNGLPGRQVTSLLEDRDGRLWVGIDQELAVYDRRKFRKIDTRDGRPLGAVRAMAEDVDGSIWVLTTPMLSPAASRYRLLRIQDLRIREEISSPKLPPTNTLAADPHSGVWLGLTSGGLARYRNGRIESFSFGQGPHGAPVHGLLVNSDASILAATSSGLIVWRNGKLQSLTVRNGLPCDVIYSLISDVKATLWLYSACGVVAIPDAELQRWWESPDATVKSRLLDVLDGAQPMSTPFRPNASRSPDGRLWFANENVVQMIDPNHLDSNPMPPQVHIETLTADGREIEDFHHVSLPPRLHNIDFAYTALSFVAPRKVRFRYKLEGYDTTWSPPVSQREVNYTNLPPGNYEFRVIACNNDGIWNETGAQLAFTIPPAFTQGTWFKTICLLGFVSLVYSAYRFRVRYVTGRLRENEERYRQIINNIPGFICTMTARGEVEFVNQRILDYTGWTLEELRNWAPIVHNDDLPHVLRSWEHSVVTGSPYDIEHRICGTDGLYRWFHVRGYPHRDSEGHIIRWCVLLNDIEESKVASEKLRRSEEYLAEAQGLSHTGSFGWNVSTGLIFWSEETYRIVDCRPGVQPTLELIFDRIHPEDRERVRQFLDRAIAGGEELDFEHRFLFTDGSIKYVHVIAHPAKDEFGNLEYIGAVTDVSDRKRAEELLRESEQRYRQIINNIPGFVSTLKPDGKVEFVNQQTLKYFGRTFEELKEWSGSDVVHPDDLPRVIEALRRSIETGEPHGVELRLRRADGVYRWFRLNRLADRDANGRIVRWYVVHHDIEEEKVASDKLRRSEAYLAEAQRLSHTGSFGWNVSSGEVSWSEETFRIFEYDQAVTPTVDLALQRVHPEDRPSMQQVADRASKEGTDFDVECRLVTPGGDVKHIQVIARGSKNLSGDLEFIGAVTDVTERKEAEQALRRSERYLAEGQRLTKSGSWAWDLRTGTLFWSEEIFRIWEFDPHIVKPAYSEFMDRVHPEDRPALEERARMESTQKDWADSEGEFRIVLPDGRIKYLHSTANPVIDKSGEVIEVVGTTTDITERKLAEEARQRSEYHLAEAQRLTHTGSFIFGVASRMASHLSDEWYRIYEFDPKKGIPTWEERLERLHPEDRSKWLRAFEQAAKNKSDYEVEFRLLFPDGRTKHLHAVGRPLLNQSGDVLQFIGSATDITERIRAQQLLERHQTEITALNQQLMKAEEEERKRIAGELHDSILQQITSVSLVLGAIKHEISGDADVKREIGDLQQRLINIGRDIRNLSHELHPAVLQDGGLPEALSSYCEEFSKTRGIPVTCEADPTAKELSPGVALCLYRVAQEVLGNVAKHSKASNVVVRLTRPDGRVRLTVTDDGVGFTPGRAEEAGGLGLINMRERVRQWHGALELKSQPGRGTTVIAEVPL